MQTEAPAVLLIGGAGSGKTYSIPSILEDPRVEHLLAFGTEPRFLESLQQSMTDRKLDLTRLHWAHVYPSDSSWEDLVRLSKTINLLTYEDLAKVKSPLKGQFDQFVQIYQTLSDFRCEHCGHSFGPVNELDASHALAIDSVTGLARMSMDLVAGGKATPHQGEWGTAMGNLERLFVKLTSSLRCFLIMTAHLERDVDQITGGTNITAQTLGNKLTPKIMPLFSEVIHARREGDRYFWSNTTTNFDTKRRALPAGHELSPSFLPIVAAYHARNPQPQPEEAA